MLAFRVYDFNVYFGNPRFQNMIYKKFGVRATGNIKNMLNIKLKRKLLVN